MDKSKEDILKEKIIK